MTVSDLTNTFYSSDSGSECWSVLDALHAVYESIRCYDGPCLNQIHPRSGQAAADCAMKGFYTRWLQSTSPWVSAIVKLVLLTSHQNAMGELLNVFLPTRHARPLTFKDLLAKSEIIASFCINNCCTLSTFSVIRMTIYNLLNHCFSNPNEDVSQHLSYFCCQRFVVSPKWSFAFFLAFKLILSLLKMKLDLILVVVISI